MLIDNLARRSRLVDIRVGPKAETRELMATWAPGIEDFVISAIAELGPATRRTAWMRWFGA